MTVGRTDEIFMTRKVRSWKKIVIWQVTLLHWQLVFIVEATSLIITFEAALHSFLLFLAAEEGS